MSFIKKFSEISKESVSLVGGKGASLGEMTNADIPVPPGFVISTEGFQKDIEKEALEAFGELNAEKVAVRSSAIAEDSVGASWAGQLETYLNVSKENLIEAIRKCWESIHSERASFYATQKNINEDELAVGVVVQKMVVSEVSGIMFTINP